jgi:ATP-dependent Clp protease ATP-binding subunit ClpB
MNRLTQKSQEALHDAHTKALRFGHTEVDGEHLLLALLSGDVPDGATVIIDAVADQLAVTWSQPARQRAEEAVPAGARAGG